MAGSGGSVAASVVTEAKTMNIYGHVMPAMQQEAAGHIDAALSEPEEADDGGDD